MNRFLASLLLFLICALICNAQDDRRVLRSGDVIQVQFSSAPQFDQVVTLGEDGKADLKLAGELRLVGLTLSQARDEIVEAVRPHIPEPDVALSFVERRYVLHVGDVLDIHYRLSPENDQTVTIEPDGHAVLYIAGDLKLAGLTLNQARAQILLAVSKTLNGAELNVILKDFQHPYVVVSGEVQNPGKFEMREDMTALQAIELAGGPRRTASKSRVILFRHLNDQRRREIVELDLSHMKKTSDLSRDQMLASGDMLYLTTSHISELETLLRTLNFGVFFNPVTDF
jgi:polysaccharide biosynthesis/export protein